MRSSSTAESFQLSARVLPLELSSYCVTPYLSKNKQYERLSYRNAGLKFLPIRDGSDDD